MIYTHELTIPKNTTKDKPIHEAMLVSYGFLYKIEIQFPSGCAGLAGIKIFDGGHQLYPSTLGLWFLSDNYTISFDDSILKLTSPFQFDLFGYNLDETYDHTIYVRAGMVEKEEYISRFLPTIAYDHLMKLIEEEKAKQQEVQAGIIENPFPWLQQ